MVQTTTLEQIFGNSEFQKLATIGGHKKFHLEGNALVHTMLVVEAAKAMFGEDDDLMIKVAALHDIGKIYTSICHGENDWEYPDHAACGAFRGILSKFIAETDADFKEVQWYIANHIKPLFWQGKDFEIEKARIMRNAPSERCTIANLAKLAICDIKGSRSVESQDGLVTFLSNIE